MAAKCEEFYCRRADRAPEKPEFFKLPSEDRQLICQLRSAITTAKDKVMQMRDDSEDKDRDLSREVALRKAAEQRLEQMVDMYGDPAVTEELRQRLPRAGKADPKARLQRELEQMDHASSLHSTGARRNLASELEDQIFTSERGRKSRSHSADSLSRRSVDRDDYRSRRNRSHSPPDRPHERPSPPRERSRDYNGGGDYPSGYPGGGGYPYPPHPAFYPPMYAYPHPPPTVMYATTPGATPTPVAHSTPAPGNAVGGVYMVSPPTVAAGPSTVHVHTTATPTPQVGVAGVVGGVAKGSGVGVTTITNESSSTETASNIRAVTVNREQQRQISMLLAELDASKDLNKQLQSKLTDSERELGSLRITAEKHSSLIEAAKSDRIAELVEEIYRAQKKRDESMMGRLRVANEERDEALLKLKRLRISAEGRGTDKQLLLGDDLDGLDERFVAAGDELVEKIKSRRQRRTDIGTEEMRAVLQERDSVVAKCRQLEAEVVKLQRLNRVRGSEKQQHSTIQAKLLATQQERDLALARVQKLEDELQTLRVYYSLHKSLTQEANMRDQYNNMLKNVEVAVKDRDSAIESTQQEKSQLMLQLKTLMAEKEALSEQLDKATNGQKEAQANCQKLERLVNVLRRKINGLGTKMDDCC